jgi:hypothetical protein
MAELYEVSLDHNSFRGGYTTKVRVIRNLEEKPKSFVGKHSRYNKSDLNRMVDYLGGRRMIVDSEEKVPQALEAIYSYIKKNLELTIERKQNQLNDLLALDIKAPITYSEK